VTADVRGLSNDVTLDKLQDSGKASSPGDRLTIASRVCGSRQMVGSHCGAMPTGRFFVNEVRAFWHMKPIYTGEEHQKTSSLPRRPLPPQTHPRNAHYAKIEICSFGGFEFSTMPYFPPPLLASTPICRGAGQEIGEYFWHFVLPTAFWLTLVPELTRPGAAAQWAWWIQNYSSLSFPFSGPGRAVAT